VPLAVVVSLLVLIVHLWAAGDAHRFTRS
jgi:hypothetical protein